MAEMIVLIEYFLSSSSAGEETCHLKFRVKDKKKYKKKQWRRR